jgi:small GTP-binding protein
MEMKMETNNIKNYKVVIAGSGGSGKTAFVMRMMCNSFFSPKYIATLGVEVHPVNVNANVVFNIWDCAGQERFVGLGDGYFIGADAAMVFYDLTSNKTYQEAQKWTDDIRRVCPNIPIILVGNKADIRDGRRAPETRFNISVKDNQLIEKNLETGKYAVSPLDNLFTALLPLIKEKVEVECNLPTPSKKVKKLLNKKELALANIEKNLTYEQKQEYYKFREDKLRELIVANT